MNHVSRERVGAVVAAAGNSQRMDGVDKIFTAVAIPIQSSESAGDEFPLEIPPLNSRRDIAEAPAALVAEIDEARGSSGLSGAVRMWILDYYRRRRAVEDYNGGNRD